MNDTYTEEHPITEKPDDNLDSQLVPPVHFHIDSVAPDKMQAILAASHAMKALCNALASACTTVSISNCHIVNSAGAGIEVSTGD